MPADTTETVILGSIYAAYTRSARTINSYYKTCKKCTIENKTILNPRFSLIKLNGEYRQKSILDISKLKLDRRIEKSGDRTRIELFQSAMVNTGRL